MCITQVIDRISQIEFGEFRTLALEYDTYICPLTEIIAMPQPENQYPDFSGKAWITKMTMQKAAAKKTSIGDDEVNKVTTTKMPPKKLQKKAKNKLSGFVTAKVDKDHVEFDDSAEGNEDIDGGEDAKMTKCRIPKRSGRTPLRGRRRVVYWPKTTKMCRQVLRRKIFQVFHWINRFFHWLLVLANLPSPKSTKTSKQWISHYFHWLFVLANLPSPKSTRTW